MRGKSWLEYMQHPAEGCQSIHADDDPAVGWELFGRAALRKGDWKILFVEPSAGGRPDGQWQLYDVVRDPGETADLSETHPEKLKELLGMWDEYVRETGTVWGEDALPIARFGKGWASGPDDLIGGDALEQTCAWMRIGHGKAVPPAH